MRRCTILMAALVAAVMMAMTGTALAASPPPNDARDNATVLPGLPSTVTGTTVGSTVDPTDPPSQCAREGGSVWYQISTGASAPAELAVLVDANGNLDASVDVFVKQRSQNLPVTCQRTDKNGEAVFDFAPQANTTYLIRVAQLANSDPGSFKLRAFVPPPPASPPGAPLAAKGASGSLARVLGDTKAYSVAMTAGVSYIVNLVSGIQGCMSLDIYAPQTTSFDATPVKSTYCQGYHLFTPQVSGTYSLLVNADSSVIGPQPFHVQVGVAGPGQTTPGLPLPNYAKVKATLHGDHTAVQRLYRFDVTARSNLQLNLNAGGQASFNLELRSAGGRVLQCACGGSGDQTLTTVLRPGRYYVAVRTSAFSSGGFTLLRRSRAITYTAVRIDGSRYSVRPPGQPVTVSVYVSAAAVGPATVVIDRFDPESGWQYNRTVRVPIVDGSGSFMFTPPSIGQWLVTASFLGSHGFSPSASRAARVLSAGPLTESVIPGGL